MRSAKALENILKVIDTYYHLSLSLCLSVYLYYLTKEEDEGLEYGLATKMLLVLFSSKT